MKEGGITTSAESWFADDNDDVDQKYNEPRSVTVACDDVDDDDDDDDDVVDVDDNDEKYNEPRSVTVACLARTRGDRGPAVAPRLLGTIPLMYPWHNTFNVPSAQYL